MDTDLSRSEATRRFNFAATLAFLITLAAHLWQFLSGFNPWLLFASNLPIIMGLALFAIRLHRRSDGAFSSAVAAETVVAFGVLALILGLVTAVGPLLGQAGAALTFDGETLKRLGAPFAQGLVAAGIAPVVAVLVRTAAAERDEMGDSQIAAAEALRQAMAALAAEMNAARSAAAMLNSALADAAQKTGRIGPEIGQNLDIVVTAAGRIGPSLSSSVAGLATTIDGAGTSLAGQLQQAGRQVAGSFGDVDARLTALASSAQAGNAELTRLGSSLGALTTQAGDAAAQLDALGAVTVSVEQFLARRGIA